VRRALTGHVTEEMQRHYSTIGLDEKRAAVAGVLRLVPPDAGAAVGTMADPTSSTRSGVPGGVSASREDEGQLRGFLNWPRSGRLS
jgi:hypothetical protein